MKKILLICNILLLSQAVQAQNSFKESLNSATKSFSQKEYSKTLQVLKNTQSLAKTEQDHVILNNSIGWTYFNKGDTEKSIDYIEKSLKGAIKINNAELAQKASNNLGIIYYSLGDINKSKTYFSNSWSKDSETSKNYLSLIKEQEEANRINSIIAKGVSYRLNADFENALIEYEKALLSSPKNVRALDYKGYALFRLGRYEEALITLKEAQSTNPTNTNVLINIMKSYCALQKPEEAALIVNNNKKILNDNKDLILSDSELKSVCGESFINNI